MVAWIARVDVVVFAASQRDQLVGDALGLGRNRCFAHGGPPRAGPSRASGWATASMGHHAHSGMPTNSWLDSASHGQGRGQPAHRLGPCVPPCRILRAALRASIGHLAVSRGFTTWVEPAVDGEPGGTSQATRPFTSSMELDPQTGSGERLLHLRRDQGGWTSRVRWSARCEPRLRGAPGRNTAFGRPDP